MRISGIRCKACRPPWSNSAVMADSRLMTLRRGPYLSDDPDLCLVERFARGESAAYDALVRKYQPHIAGLVCRLLAWDGDVDDVVQEVFLAALRGLPSFRGQSSVSTWLTRIAINKCRSHRRRQILSLKRWLTGRNGHSNAAPCSEPPADRATLDQERFARVRRAVDRLPARYREVVVLRYLEQLSTEETCAVLGTRPATLQVRLHRARELLRDALADMMIER